MSDAFSMTVWYRCSLSTSRRSVVGEVSLTMKASRLEPVAEIGRKVERRAHVTLRREILAS
jgi:hypothetical protein